MKEIGALIKKDIIEVLTIPLRKAGVFYRVFARGKSVDSIRQKLAHKREKYISKNEKMQDIIGIRIVFYFIEDVWIYYNYLKTKTTYVGESNSELELLDIPEIGPLKNTIDKVFMPQRLNLIFKISNEQYSKELLGDLESELSDEDIKLIDNTYEVQLRTVLSEGWHEVEHDLRYKSIDENWWNYCVYESRMLNGIYASLETNDRAMEHLFSNIAYKNYKQGDWDAMLRNHFRIRIQIGKLSEDLIELLNNNHKIAKNILKFERSNLFNVLQSLTLPLPLTLNNIVFLINRLEFNDDNIKGLEPHPVSLLLDREYSNKIANDRG